MTERQEGVIAQRELFYLYENGPLCVSPGEDGKQLSCDFCKDESLYHDANAWFNQETNTLACYKCLVNKCEPLENVHIVGYIKVLTFHWNNNNNNNNRLFIFMIQTFFTFKDLNLWDENFEWTEQLL